MARLNFEEFCIPTGIRRAGHQVVDAREGIADLVYMNAGGIRAHRLAFKILDSKGSTDYDEGELRIIRDIVNRMGVCNIIDALDDQLKNLNGKEE